MTASMWWTLADAILAIGLALSIGAFLTARELERDTDAQ